VLKGAERGCLAIADISGYTSLMVGSELEHAQDALRDLIQTVVGQLRPQFRLAKLEGDAAFVYAVTDRIDASLLLDTTESAYFAFRRRLDAISRATTCDCNACLLLSGLNLKIVAHQGEFVRERVFGTEELTGTSVIVIHRLLKNHISEQLGHDGYLFLTDTAASAAALDPMALGMRRHTESVDGVGEVPGWIHDLEAAWRREKEQHRVRVTDKDAFGRVEGILPAAPAIAWERLTSPSDRVRWQPGVLRVEQELETGRRGVGMTTHCVHGDRAILEEMLDWRPFDYFTLRSTLPGLGSFVSTTELSATADGTRMVVRFRKPRTAAERALYAARGEEALGLYRASMDSLAALLAAEAVVPEAIVAG
jgi:hypothetical protein